MACAKGPLLGRIALAPVTASAFRNFLREVPESKGIPVVFLLFAGVSYFLEERFPIFVSPYFHRTMSCVGAQHNMVRRWLSAFRAGNQRGSEEGGMMLLIRM